MAKKRKSAAAQEDDGEHVPRKKRAPVLLDREWCDLAERLATKEEKPTTWYVMKLVAAEADKLDEERPALPWE